MWARRNALMAGSLRAADSSLGCAGDLGGRGIDGKQEHGNRIGKFRRHRHDPTCTMKTTIP
jgi:hypothetical protein